MPKMKDSGIEWIGEIPEEWELIKIAGLYSLRNTKVSDNDYPPLSVTMKGIVPQLETAAKTNDHDNRKLVKKGDFAINSRSDRRGSCGVSEYDGSVSLINTVMKPNRSMNSQYYNWLFHMSLFADEFYKWGHGIVDDLWTTTWQDMKKITVPFPAIEIQKSIANFLDQKCAEIDSLSADIEKEIETLEEYKKSVITEAVTKGLDPDVEMKDSGIEFIGNIPTTWNVLKFKNIGTYRNGLTYSPSDLCDESEGILVLRSSNIQHGKLEFQDNAYVSSFVPNSLMVQKDDILICSRNGSQKLVGKSAIIPNALKASFGAFMMIFKCNEKVIPKYAYYLLNSGVFSYYLASFFTSTINQLTGSNFGNMKIPFCNNLLEQEKIIYFLDTKCSEIDLAIEEKRQQLETLTEYKKSLIYEYVTGKKEVPVEDMTIDDDAHRNAVILGLIADKLGELQSGRIQLQKIQFMMAMYVMTGQKTQYYRYNHGPYDICLNDYIDILLKNKWYQEKKDGAYILAKGENHSEFLNTYKELIDKLEPEIDKLLNLLKSMNVLKTSRIERVATLYAAWNDLLLDGVSPTDDQIIENVMNNWTENKGNTQYVTWKDSLEKMKQNGLIPKGTGKHTLTKQQ